MNDQPCFVHAIQEAQSILARHIEPEQSKADMAIQILLSILNRTDVVWFVNYQLPSILLGNVLFTLLSGADCLEELVNFCLKSRTIRRKHLCRS